MSQNLFQSSSMNPKPFSFSGGSGSRSFNDSLILASDEPEDKINALQTSFTLLILTSYINIFSLFKEIQERHVLLCHQRKP